MRIEEKANYPRPDFVRREMLSLNGTWQFAFDDSPAPLGLNSLCTPSATQPIIVPFPYQSPASGIGREEVHGKLYYTRTFSLTAEQAQKTVLLKCGAVDYYTLIFINGKFAGSHKGGYTPIALNISSLVAQGENEITLWVEDNPTMEQMRGKQVWNEPPFGCFYTAVSGIWQDVWLEFTAPVYVEQVHFTPDTEHRRVEAEVRLNGFATGTLAFTVSKEGEPTLTLTRSFTNTNVIKTSLQTEEYGMRDNYHVNWSPAHPNLFDCDITLTVQGKTDEVSAYFGIRKIKAEGGKIYLNNSQVYLRGILDQGYWREGIYRPATDEGFRTDVEMTLALGFNLARKHQKIEDPKFYYWADRLGLMVWGELPSFFAFSDSTVKQAADTVEEFIARDYNHPCIVTWVPFNESWGLRMLLGDSRFPNTARSLYYLCKALDPTRLVSTNDGWEQLNETDILGIHDYRLLKGKLTAYYSDRAFLQNGSARTGHPYLIPGQQDCGQPIMLTEFGGRRPEGGNGWGYELPVESREKLAEAVKEDVDAVLAMPTVCGYCYTQLTDVYQEENGLLDMARKPKFDPQIMKSIFSRNP